MDNEVFGPVPDYNTWLHQFLNRMIDAHFPDADEEKREIIMEDAHREYHENCRSDVTSVPWKVISHVDMPNSDGDENVRIIGFKCQMPADAPFMTFEKMRWLEELRFGQVKRNR